jgi:hypothetical protein
VPSISFGRQDAKVALSTRSTAQPISHSGAARRTDHRVQISLSDIELVFKPIVRHAQIFVVMSESDKIYDIIRILILKEEYYFELVTRFQANYLRRQEGDNRHAV